MYKAMMCAAVAAVTAGSALADVRICNYTRRPISVAVAARVDNPYPAWEVQGWWNLQPGRCAIPFTGDYTGEQVYYYGEYMDNGAPWIAQNPRTATVCVRADGKAFTLRGSASQVQNCGYGYTARTFYGTSSTARNFSIDLHD
jgi:uncharacterized membrane protein